MNLRKYIASAMRYATAETGFSDWNDFIIIVNDYEIEVEQTILGMNVYVVPSSASHNYRFIMAYSSDIDIKRARALRSILEYQEFN